MFEDATLHLTQITFNFKELFRQHMVYFVVKLELSDKKYQTSGTVMDINFKVKLLFPMKEFLSFGTVGKAAGCNIQGCPLSLIPILRS